MEEGRFSRRKFLRLGAVAGLGSVAAPVALTGCGGGQGSQSGGGQSSQGEATTDGTTAEVGGGGAIAATSEVPANSARTFTDSNTGQPAVLVHLQSGDFVAYSAVCTHRGCTVSYQPQSQELVCPCHGGTFDPAQGAAVVSGPPQTPLPQIDVAVQGGEVVRT